MVVPVISEMDLMPARRLPVPGYLLLSVSLLNLIPLPVVTVGNNPVISNLSFSSDACLFPGLKPQAVIAVQGFLALSVCFPEHLAVAVVFILLKIVLKSFESKTYLQFQIYFYPLSEYKWRKLRFNCYKNVQTSKKSETEEAE